ncbi:MAG: MFS transporter [Gaiellales bacterium]
MSASNGVQGNAAASRSAYIAGSVGSIIEWYDFAIFGAFAVVLARVFFPADDEMAGVLRTFAIFGVGFIARPLGAIVFGSLGDRIGRRRTLMIAIVAIAVPTVLMACLPTPAQIGQWATLLLVALRFLQGFSAGGEGGGAITFIGEHAAAGRRARAINWAESAITCGLLLGAVVAFAISSALSESQLDAWGWRLAFALTLPLLVIGAIVRRGAGESPEFEAARDEGRVVAHPVAAVARSHAGALIRGFFLIGGGYAFYYFLATFIPAFLQMHAGLTFSTSFLLATLNLAVVIVTYRVSAEISDRWGARRTVLAGSAVLLVVAYPAWLLITHGGTAPAALGGVLLSIAIGLVVVPQIVILMESFPTELRYTGYSLTANVAGAVFGGTVAFAATGLMMTSGSARAPIAIVVGAALMTLIVAALYPRDAD